MKKVISLLFFMALIVFAVQGACENADPPGSFDDEYITMEVNEIVSDFTIIDMAAIHHPVFEHRHPKQTQYPEPNVSTLKTRKREFVSNLPITIRKL